MEDYKGKVAVITGGASGIGLALALELGKRGCNIVITDINAEKGKKAESQLKDNAINALSIEDDIPIEENWAAVIETTKKQFGDQQKDNAINAMFIEHDVTIEENWDAVIETIKKQYSEVHYLFNNAGIMLRPAPLTKLTLKDWQWVMNVNVWGALYGLRKFTDLMMAQEAPGKIITTASTASVAPFSNWGPYSVSKAAVLRMVECYQAEANLFKNDKIKYSVALPGTVESEISNCDVCRPKEYANSDVTADYIPPSKAGTPEGNALGKITAALCAERILKQIDYGYTYLFTHRDLTTGLILEQANTVLLNKPPVDQIVFDFGYYAKKIERNK